MATTTCPHGFAPGTCLICRTLGLQAAPEGGRRSRTAHERVDASSVEVLGRDAARPVRRRSWGLRLATGGLGFLLVVVAVVWALTIVWALLRLIEVVAVAVIAAYMGWKLGVRHGRRHPAPPR